MYPGALSLKNAIDPDAAKCIDLDFSMVLLKFAMRAMDVKYRLTMLTERG